MVDLTTGKCEAPTTASGVRCAWGTPGNGGTKFLAGPENVKGKVPTNTSVEVVLMIENAIKL